MLFVFKFSAMGKFMKPGKVVLVLSGRFAGRKAVIVKVGIFFVNDFFFYSRMKWPRFNPMFLKKKKTHCQLSLFRCRCRKTRVLYD